MIHRRTPPPPPDIAAEMAEAGRLDDQVRLGLAQARYEAWLNEKGFAVKIAGTSRPDKAVK